MAQPINEPHNFMFNQEVVAALRSLAQTRTEEGYLQRQEVLAQKLPCDHDELIDVAYDFEEPSIRIEALELLVLAAKEGFRTVLSDSAHADPDPVVQKHAEALLFRVIVNDNIRKLSSTIVH